MIDRSFFYERKGCPLKHHFSFIRKKLRASDRHPRMYDGKVCPNDRVRFVSVSETGNVSLHTAVVNSPSPKRSIRVVYPVRRQGGKVSAALLFSADIHLPATDICRFYKSRFQTEFLFRDAKQFTGLPDCQARCGISPDFRIIQPESF